jgi:FkbM family methyltransferase
MESIRYLLRKAALGVLKLFPRSITTRLLQLLLQEYQLKVVAPYGRAANKIIIYPDGIFVPIINLHQYGEREVKLFQNYLTPDMILFDVGAHIGVYTLLFYEFVMHGNGRIYCFEPVKETFRHLEDNISLNRAPNDKISAHNIALFDRNGILSASVYDQREFSGLNTLGDRNMKILGRRLPQNKETVVCQTLDEFVDRNDIQNIHLIKIDVEGSEFAVLRGGVNTIRNQINNKLFIIMIEISDNTLMSMNTRSADLLDYATQLGLKVCEYIPERNELESHEKKRFYKNQNLILCPDVIEINKHLNRS